jgi:hypothetical protein
MSAEKTATCKVSGRRCRPCHHRRYKWSKLRNGASHLQGISDQSGAVLTTGGISEAEAERGQPPARYQRPSGAMLTTGGISEADAERGQSPARYQGGGADRA